MLLRKYMKSIYEQVDLTRRKTQKAATAVEHLEIKCPWMERAVAIGVVIGVYGDPPGLTVIICETKNDAW